MRNFVKDEDGSVIVIAALIMSILVVSLSFAVDTGNWHYNISKMKNAAESGSLCGMNQLFTRDSNESINGINTQIVNMVKDTILTNDSDLVNVPDIIWGTLDINTKTLKSPTTTAPWGSWSNTTGTSIDACEVIVKKNQELNGGVKNFFWSNNTNMPIIKSISYLPIVGTLEAGGAFPIAVYKGEVGNYGQNKTLTTHGNNDDNIGWTTFFDPPGSAKIEPYLNGSKQAPELIADPVNGTRINLSNGNKGEPVCSYVVSHAKADGSFSVILPVIDTLKFIQDDPVVGFAEFVILSAQDKGNGKLSMTGYFKATKISNGKAKTNNSYNPTDFGLRVEKTTLIN